jgi:hypothetical protein
MNWEKRAPTRAELEATARGRWTCYAMLVTPEMAAAWLTANTANRAVRRSHAVSLARLMRAGEWRLTHQGVAFDRSGHLIDGQHRLLAIVEAGVPVEILVFVDCPDDTFGALDRGLKRQLRDDLKQDSRVVDQVSWMVRLHLGTGNPDRGLQVSAAAARSCMLAMQEGILATLSASGANKRGRSQAGVRAAISLRWQSAADDDRPYLLDQWRAWLNLDVADMSPSVQRLLKRLDPITSEGSARQNEMAMCTWIGFDPAMPNQTEIDLRDRAAVLAEMRQALRDAWPDADAVTGKAA